MDERTCQGCDTVIVPGARERNKRRWCSDACRISAYREAHPEYQIRKAELAARRHRETFVPVPLHSLTCSTCGETFLARNATALYCSQLCRGRALTAARKADGRAKAYREQNADRIHAYNVEYAPKWRVSDTGRWAIKAGGCRRRARMNDVELEEFTHVEIFERDRWICGLCESAIDPELRWPDRMSASLDHVIPISLGGGHLRSNVQPAHLVCNIRKGNRVAISA